MNFMLPAAALAAISLTLTACAGAGTATQTVTAVETVTASSEPEPTSTPTPTPTPSPTRTSREPEPDPTPEPELTFVMPDVIGINLQEAQDYLQSLGSYLLDQEDASGAGRIQILDRNWYVCSQQPAPGTEVPIETVVTLYSVKLDERCP